MTHVIGHEDLRTAFKRNKRGTPISSELPSNLFQGLGPTAGRPELPTVGPRTTLPGNIPLAEEPSRGLRSRISGAFGSIADRFADPKFTKGLGQFAAAISPRSQVAASLGGLAETISEGVSEDAFRRRLAAGEKPGEIFGGLTGALTPEARAGAIEEAFRGREVTATETAAARRGVAKPFTANFQLNADGTPAPAGVKNKFSVDPLTSELTFIGPVETAEEVVEKELTGSEFSEVGNLLNQEFLSSAEANIRSQFTEGEVGLQDALRALDISPTTGRVNTAKIFSALTEEDKKRFKQRRQFYQRGLRANKLLGDLAREALPELEVTTREEFEALEVGTKFIRNGRIFIKTQDGADEVGR